MYDLRKTEIRALVLLGSLISVSPASAWEQEHALNPEEHRSFYVSGFLGATDAFSSSAEMAFSPAVKSPVTYSLDSALNWGVSAGYQYSHFRIEAEFQDIRADASGATVGRLQANMTDEMQYYVGFLNAYAMVWLDSDFKAFFGGGIGYATGTSPTISLTRGCACIVNGDADGVAWQLRGGLEYNIDNNLRAFVQYSHIGLPAPSSGGSYPRLEFSDLKLGAISAGLRWKF
jgi:opacity protein-like surface antigen